MARSAGWERKFLGRHFSHRGRRGFLWRRFRIVCGRGRAHRPLTLGFQYRPVDSCLAHELCSGRRTVRGDRSWEQRSLFFYTALREGQQVAIPPRIAPKRLDGAGNDRESLKTPKHSYWIIVGPLFRGTAADEPNGFTTRLNFLEGAFWSRITCA